MNPKKSPVAVSAAEGALNYLGTYPQIARHWPTRQLSCGVLDAGLSGIRSVEEVVAGYAAQTRLILAELRAIADARKRRGRP